MMVRFLLVAQMLISSPLVKLGICTVSEIVEALELMRDIGWSILAGEQMHGFHLGRS